MTDRRMTTAPIIRDVRASMPNYEHSQALRRPRVITGIAVHHSATANRVTGVSLDDAASIFRYHVETLGWSRGGYHYLVHPNGLVEYALDEDIPALHAGFADPDDALGLECGQYWNNHLIAICVLGWFERDRMADGGTVAIPNRFVAPTPTQWRALLQMLGDLVRRHGLDAAAVKGHRELAGCRTQCPGSTVDLDHLRAALREAASQAAG